MRNYKPSEFISGMLHSDVIIIKKEKKLCIACKEEKAINDFARLPRANDGRRNTCRQCAKEHNKTHRLTKKTEKDLYSQFMPI